MNRRISITDRFVDDVRFLVNEFGAVRYDSLVRYLEIYFDISREAAVKIAEMFLQKEIFVKVKYSGTTIVKTEKAKRSANYDNLDAFVVYCKILEEEKEKGAENDVTAEHTGLPTDFVFASTTNLIYDVIINNDKGGQKLKLLEKSDKKRYKNQITLFVIPSGTDIDGFKAPNIKGKHRLALVRRSDKTGTATCAIAETQGENNAG